MRGLAAALAVHLAMIATWFVVTKAQNDRSIAVSTARIAVAIEDAAASKRIHITEDYRP